MSSTLFLLCQWVGLLLCANSVHATHSRADVVTTSARAAVDAAALSAGTDGSRVYYRHLMNFAGAGRSLSQAGCGVPFRPCCPGGDPCEGGPAETICSSGLCRPCGGSAQPACVIDGAQQCDGDLTALNGFCFTSTSGDGSSTIGASPGATVIINGQPVSGGAPPAAGGGPPAAGGGPPAAGEGPPAAGGGPPAAGGGPPAAGGGPDTVSITINGQPVGGTPGASPGPGTYGLPAPAVAPAAEAPAPAPADVPFFFAFSECGQVGQPCCVPSIGGITTGICTAPSTCQAGGDFPTCADTAECSDGAVSFGGLCIQVGVL